MKDHFGLRPFETLIQPVLVSNITDKVIDFFAKRQGIKEVWRTFWSER